MPAIPLVMFAPRGLITILLFIGIPQVFRIPVISEEVITLVIFFSIFIMMIGNIMNRDEQVSSEEEKGDKKEAILPDGKM